MIRIDNKRGFLYIGGTVLLVFLCTFICEKHVDLTLDFYLLHMVCFTVTNIFILQQAWWFRQFRRLQLGTEIQVILPSNWQKVKMIKTVWILLLTKVCFCQFWSLGDCRSKYCREVLHPAPFRCNILPSRLICILDFSRSKGSICVKEIYPAYTIWRKLFSSHACMCISYCSMMELKASSYILTVHHKINTCWWCCSNW